MDNNLQNNRNLARSPNIYLDNEYSDWILELKQRYKNAQLKTAVKVNSELLLFNWLLGKDLVSRKFEEKWGDGIVEQISNDLQTAFPDAKGFSSRNLWFMKHWFVIGRTKTETGCSRNEVPFVVFICSLGASYIDCSEMQDCKRGIVLYQAYNS